MNKDSSVNRTQGNAGFLHQVKIKLKVPEDVELFLDHHHPSLSADKAKTQQTISRDGDQVTIDLDLLMNGKQALGIFASKVI